MPKEDFREPSWFPLATWPPKIHPFQKDWKRRTLKFPKNNGTTKERNPPGFPLIKKVCQKGFKRVNLQKKSQKEEVKWENNGHQL